MLRRGAKNFRKQRDARRVEIVDNYMPKEGNIIKGGTSDIKRILAGLAVCGSGRRLLLLPKCRTC